MGLTRIDMDTWPRREHFEHYYRDVRCTYSLTVEVDITAPLAAAKARGIKTYPMQLYLLATAVSRVPAFRTTYSQAEGPGYWDVSHPSYTVFHRETETFSSIWTEYNPDFSVFYARVLADIAAYGGSTLFAPKVGEPDNTFSVSSVPWVDFTAFNLNLYTEGTYLSPIFTIGRHRVDAQGVRMPLAIQVHHAACDGYHVGVFCRTLEDLIAGWCEWMP